MDRRCQPRGAGPAAPERGRYWRYHHGARARCAARRFCCRATSSRPQQPQQLRLLNGAVLFAQVQVDASVLPCHHASSQCRAGRCNAGAGPRLQWCRCLGGAGYRRRPLAQCAADKARRVVGKPITVLLIQGESGMGKEMFARALHASGPRRDAPLCGDQLRRHAGEPDRGRAVWLRGWRLHRCARKEGRPGCLREADGGTLVPWMRSATCHWPMQTRLLRVLQERTGDAGWALASP